MWLEARLAADPPAALDLAGHIQRTTAMLAHLITDNIAVVTTKAA
jgi:hypothetical protein